MGSLRLSRRPCTAARALVDGGAAPRVVPFLPQASGLGEEAEGETMGFQTQSMCTLPHERKRVQERSDGEMEGYKGKGTRTLTEMLRIGQHPRARSGEKE